MSRSASSSPSRAGKRRSVLTHGSRSAHSRPPTISRCSRAPAPRSTCGKPPTLHLLTGDDPVLEWVKGTALRPILDALGDGDARDEFLAELGRACGPRTRRDRTAPCSRSDASSSSPRSPDPGWVSSVPMSDSPSAAVRAQVDHPIIDADGHFVEIGPLLADEVLTHVEDIGGAAMRDRYLASGVVPTDTSSVLADRSRDAVREQWSAMPSWWGWSTRNVRDRATSHLPAMLYERLDELGIDVTILYPSMSLAFLDAPDPELAATLCRAVNRIHARVRALRGSHARGCARPDAAPRPCRGRARVRGPRARLSQCGHLRPCEAAAHRGEHLPVSPRHVRPRQRLRLRPVLGRVHRARRGARVAQLGAAPPGDTVDLELRLQPRRRARRRPRSAVQVVVPRWRDPPVPAPARRVPRGRRCVGVCPPR